MTEITLLAQARRDDWNLAGQYCQNSDTDLKDRWNKFAESYHRLYENGSTFHLARLKSLAKYVGHSLESPTAASDADILVVGNRLLDRVMDARASELGVEEPPPMPEIETVSEGSVTRDDIEDFFSRTRVPSGMRVTQ